MGLYRGHVINGVLAQTFSHGPRGPQIYHAVISPVPECITRIRILSSWQNPHMGSLNCAMRGYMGKAKWKPGELTKENNSDEKQYYILTGIAEFTPTNKEL